jgi:multicomponent Na+:H+ antiporter subunit E
VQVPHPDGHRNGEHKMTIFLWNALLATVWMALVGFSETNFFIGFVIGYFILSLTRKAFRSTSYFDKVNQITRFVFFFLHELVTANLQISRVILRPKLEIQPSVVAIPLDVTSDLEITFFANLISLTPGTLSLEISPDSRVLYVHGIDVPDNIEFIRKLKSGLEARILEVVR